MADREPLEGRRVAVLGLGRSGLAIVRAALERGAEVEVYDRARREDIVKREVLAQVESLGVPIRFGWDRPLGPGEADLLVANPAVDSRSPTLRATREAGVTIWSEIEFAFRISQAPIVAVTGTNGKSTTAVMTHLALAACGASSVLCGNIFGTGYGEVPLTDAAAASNRDQVLVAEVSSFQLEWVERFQPVSAAITNISEDHLDRYDSFRDYAATKQRIFSAQRAGQFAIVREEDPVVVPPSEPEGPTVLTFGEDGRHARVVDGGIELFGEFVPLPDLAWLGRHNLHNAGAAALLTAGFLAWKSGDAPCARPEIGEGLREFRGIEHRMEPVGERNGIRIVNNSMCTNPEAVVRSAVGLAAPVRLIVGGINKGLDFEPVRRFLQDSGARCYLYGASRAEILDQIGGGHPSFGTLQEAFEAAIRDARPGEVVMLAPGCASTDQFDDFRHRGNVFKTLAREWLDR
jgi:UDP-N-acetylmuramoylalanine--D-glutamate ligase